jgi:hypothetical protein
VNRRKGQRSEKEKNMDLFCEDRPRKGELERWSEQNASIPVRHQSLAAHPMVHVITGRYKIRLQ